MTYQFEDLEVQVEVEGEAFGHVAISDATGEILRWHEQEWIEDPSPVANIVNAIMIGVTVGPQALRLTLGEHRDGDTE